ncbi:Hypothetical protein PBC10988_21490 [Planctomycetales bacterium 10988]|nr:Hypothetical protein PBC10988_21490 [Planctomycetales bacterium 10988]
MSQLQEAYSLFLGIISQQGPLNYYQLLGLENPNASAEEITQAAKRQLAKLKKHAGSETLAAERKQLAQEIKKAYALLTNTEKKKVYDSRLQETTLSETDRPTLAMGPKSGSTDTIRIEKEVTPVEDASPAKESAEIRQKKKSPARKSSEIAGSSKDAANRWGDAEVLLAASKPELLREKMILLCGGIAGAIGLVTLGILYWQLSASGYFDGPQVVSVPAFAPAWHAEETEQHTFQSSAVPLIDVLAQVEEGTGLQVELEPSLENGPWKARSVSVQAEQLSSPLLVQAIAEPLELTWKQLGPKQYQLTKITDWRNGWAFLSDEGMENLLAGPTASEVDSPSIVRTNGSGNSVPVVASEENQTPGFQNSESMSEDPFEAISTSSLISHPAWESAALKTVALVKIEFDSGREQLHHGLVVGSPYLVAVDERHLGTQQIRSIKVYFNEGAGALREAQVNGTLEMPSGELVLLKVDQASPDEQFLTIAAAMPRSKEVYLLHGSIPRLPLSRSENFQLSLSIRDNPGASSEDWVVFAAQQVVPKFRVLLDGKGNLLSLASKYGTFSQANRNVVVRPIVGLQGDLASLVHAEPKPVTDAAPSNQIALPDGTIVHLDQISIPWERTMASVPTTYSRIRDDQGNQTAANVQSGMFVGTAFVYSPSGEPRLMGNYQPGQLFNQPQSFRQGPFYYGDTSGNLVLWAYYNQAQRDRTWVYFEDGEPAIIQQYEYGQLRRQYLCEDRQVTKTLNESDPFSSDWAVSAQTVLQAERQIMTFEYQMSSKYQARFPINPEVLNQIQSNQNLGRNNPGFTGGMDPFSDFTPEPQVPEGQGVTDGLQALLELGITSGGIGDLVDKLKTFGIPPTLPDENFSEVLSSSEDYYVAAMRMGAEFNGLVMAWDEEGTQRFAAIYEKGDRSDLLIYADAKGTIRYAAEHQNDRKNGWVCLFDEAGLPWLVQDYETYRVDEQWFCKEGKLVRHYPNPESFDSDLRVAREALAEVEQEAKMLEIDLEKGLREQDEEERMERAIENSKNSRDQITQRMRQRAQDRQQRIGEMQERFSN